MCIVQVSLYLCICDYASLCYVYTSMYTCVHLWISIVHLCAYLYTCHLHMCSCGYHWGWRMRGARHFMELLGATLLPIDVETRGLVNFSRAQGSLCHSPNLCSWTQGLLAHSTTHWKAKDIVLWHWVSNSLLNHVLSPCQSADFDVRSFSFYTKAGERNCYTVCNYECLTQSRAGSWEGPFMGPHLAYCL